MLKFAKRRIKFAEPSQSAELRTVCGDPPVKYLMLLLSCFTEPIEDVLSIAQGRATTQEVVALPRDFFYQYRILVNICSWQLAFNHTVLYDIIDKNLTFHNWEHPLRRIWMISSRPLDAKPWQGWKQCSNSNDPFLFCQRGQRNQLHNQ